VSAAMREAIEECRRRREIQAAFNKKHHVTPASIEKAIRDGIEVWADEDADKIVAEAAGQNEEDYLFSQMLSDLERDMELAARNLQFEKAAVIRDKIKEMRQTQNVMREGLR